MSEAHSGQIEIDGVSLEVRAWGLRSGVGLPILLLHEGLGSVSLWRDFPQKLSEETGRHVIAWSRQGHGDSEAEMGPRSIHYMHIEAALVPRVLMELGVSRAHLFGHSDGGSIAIIAAAQSPKYFASMVLEAPHVYVEELTRESIVKLASSFSKSDLGARMNAYHRDPDALFRHWSKIWLDPEFHDWNIEEFVPTIKAPALLIQGKDDQYGTMDQLDRIEANLGIVKRLELENCRHSPHRDCEAAVLESVRRFLHDKE